MRDFLSKLKDEDLHRKVEFKNPRGETRSMALGDLMQHAANHGVPSPRTGCAAAETARVRAG